MLLQLWGLAYAVRDHIPLEQGLRPEYLKYKIMLVFRQRPYSIRTRIKTSRVKKEAVGLSVRDHIPLEQGLRLSPLLLSDCLTSETIFH